MGHRKQSAPRHGSMAFLPRKRAESMVARVRYWPQLKLDKPTPLAFAGYKVAMTQTMLIDDRDGSPTKGKEIAVPITIVEAPPLTAVGARIYANGTGEKRVAKEVWSPKLPPDVFRRLATMENSHERGEAKIGAQEVPEGGEVRLIVCTQPRLTGSDKKKPEIFEVKVDGGSQDDVVNYVNSTLGKEIKVRDVLKPGSFVDVFGITKGKGWQGVVKRYHVRILDRKSNKTRRGIATMGAKSPSNVAYYIPRGGQMGYHQRPIRNIRILSIESAAESPKMKGGFLRYGNIKSDCLLLEGSIQGPSKRFLKLRYSARRADVVKEPPKLTHVSLVSQQGV